MPKCCLVNDGCRYRMSAYHARLFWEQHFVLGSPYQHIPIAYRTPACCFLYRQCTQPCDLSWSPLQWCCVVFDKEGWAWREHCGNMFATFYLNVLVACSNISYAATPATPTRRGRPALKLRQQATSTYPGSRGFNEAGTSCTSYYTRRISS